MAVSLLSDMPVPRKRRIAAEGIVGEDTQQPFPSGRRVGLDPGKRNIVTMICEKGKKLKYTAKQRNFESNLYRYRDMLKRGRTKGDVDALETDLSSLSHKTVGSKEYLQ